MKRKVRAASLHRIDQRRLSLNTHFQAIPDSTGQRHWCTGQNDVTRQQCKIGGNETDQPIAVKNKLGGISSFAELAVLKKLMLRSCGSIFVSTYGPSGVKVSNDLALAIGSRYFDRTIADVLGRRVTENVTGGGGWRHVPHLSADDDAKLGFEIVR